MLAFVELFVYSDYFILQRRIMIIHELKQANVDEDAAVDEGGPTEKRVRLLLPEAFSRLYC